MVWQKHDYDSIPGTFVFNGERSNKGYQINKMAFSFNSAENRAEFARDMGAYCDKFELKPDEKAAVVAGDFGRLLELGGNIYYLAKIAIFHGMSIQDACAKMSNITTEEFIQRLQKNSEGFQQKLDNIGGYFGG